MVIDTLAMAKRYEEAGFSIQQAEALAEEQVALIEDQLATKRDLKAMEERLTYRLTLRLGAMLAASIGIVTALVRLT